MPDFRNSYKFGSARSRSERVNIILQTLLSLACSEPKPETVVLIGHSQGGAAVAQTCAMDSVVRNANIKGI